MIKNLSYENNCKNKVYQILLHFWSTALFLLYLNKLYQKYYVTIKCQKKKNSQKYCRKKKTEKIKVIWSKL